MHFQPLFEKQSRTMGLGTRHRASGEGIFIISDEEAQSSENMKSNALIFLQKALGNFGVPHLIDEDH